MNNTGIVEDAYHENYSYNGFSTHTITIESEEYKLYSSNPNKHVYKGDKISFIFKEEKGKNVIDLDSLVTIDKNGKFVKRPSITKAPPTKSNSNGLTVKDATVTKYGTNQVKSVFNDTIKNYRHSITVDLEGKQTTFVANYDDRNKIVNVGDTISFDYFHQGKYKRIKKQSLLIPESKTFTKPSSKSKPKNGTVTNKKIKAYKVEPTYTKFGIKHPQFNHLILIGKTWYTFRDKSHRKFIWKTDACDFKYKNEGGGKNKIDKHSIKLYTHKGTQRKNRESPCEETFTEYVFEEHFDVITYAPEMFDNKETIIKNAYRRLYRAYYNGYDPENYKDSHYKFIAGVFSKSDKHFAKLFFTDQRGIYLSIEYYRVDKVGEPLSEFGVERIDDMNLIKELKGYENE